MAQLMPISVPISVPSWLEPLLSTPFFCFRCPNHPCWPHSKCNLFCLDCAALTASFCINCRQCFHRTHRVIQIRRSSYCDVVRVSELQDHLDVSEIQTYSINNDQVVFLNERRQYRPGVAHIMSLSNCDVCDRSLLGYYRFCSLSCKFVRMKTHGNAKLTLVEHGLKEKEKVTTKYDLKEKEEVSSKYYLKEKDEVTVKYIVKEKEEVAAKHVKEKEEVVVEQRYISGAKRRKGIPRRAPLF